MLSVEFAGWVSIGGRKQVYNLPESCLSIVKG